MALGRRVLILPIAAFVLLSWSMSARVSAAPLNDDVIHAFPVPQQGAALSVDLTGATTAPDDPTCGAPVYRTIWYVYTSPVDQFIQAALGDTSGSTPVRPRLSVWTGSPGALSVAQCDPDAHEVEFQATAGAAYYFEVASPTPDGVTKIRLNVNPHAYVNPYTPIPPANDLFWYAVPVPEIPYATTADVGAGSGDDSYDPRICDGNSCFVFGDTLWYRYTATALQEVDALFTETFDAPYVAVFTGSLDDLVPVASSVEGKSKSGATRFTTQPGETYSIMFASSYDHLYSLPAALAVRPAPPPTGGSISVSPTASLRRQVVCFPDIGCWIETHILADVQVTCAAPVPSVGVALSVTQGGNEASGRGTAHCSTGAGHTTIDMTAPNGFRKGSATVDASASDYDANYYVQAGPLPLTISRHAGP